MNSSSQTDIPEIIKQAATWLSKVHRGPLSDAEASALTEWRSQSKEHEQAWQKAELLSAKFKDIPESVGMSVLSRPTSMDRRAFIKPLAALLIAAPTGLLAYRQLPWQNWIADYSTKIGMSKSYQLADGSALTLNTNSAVDIDYNNQYRIIKLHQGEIYIETAKDSLHRPFSVLTKHGRLTALGTKFLVRTDAESSYLGVLQGAVEIAAKDNSALPVVIQANYQSTFSTAAVDPASPLDPNANAWLEGFIYADNMPLEDFIRMVSRYRTGVLKCDESAKDVRISGAFQLKDPEHILEVIQTTRPLRIVWRTRYWGTIYKA